MSAKKISPKEHRKHVHHTLLYVSAVTAAIITVLVSVVSLTKVNVSSCDQNHAKPNTLELRVCSPQRRTAYGWPWLQVDGEPWWPSVANFAFFSLIIFGLTKSEAHIKGHIQPKSHSS